MSSGICIDGPVLVAGVSALNVFPEPHLPSGSAETYVTTQVRKNSALTSNHDDNSNGIEWRKFKKENVVDEDNVFGVIVDGSGSDDTEI